MKYAVLALFLLSGSAVAQERRIPPDGCCIPQNRQSLRAEYRAGQCLSNNLKRMTCEEVYGRFNMTHAHINENALNQFGRLSGPVMAAAPVSATAPPPPPSVPGATVPPPIVTPLPIDPEKMQPAVPPQPR